jgi:predicted enzyme related to lactoylglutathione lyase
MKSKQCEVKPTNRKEIEMSSIDVDHKSMKLEVLVLPVFNVDRAKDFYKTLGWRLNADFVTDEDFRVTTQRQ